jgi:DNA mismatch repair protein MutS
MIARITRKRLSLYFELTTLPKEFTCIRNVHLKATLANNRIAFLYKVEEGHASRSYGLEVAALAGIPSDVLKLAHQHLKQQSPTDYQACEPIVTPPFSRLA